MLYSSKDPDFDFLHKVLGLQGIKSGVKHLCPDGPSRRLCIGLKTLRVLTLVSIAISGEDLEYLLRSCPVLETVSVHNSWKLTGLRVFGPSLALKHLNIHDCWEIKSVEICDAPIVSLSVDCRTGTELRLANVPLLVEVSTYSYACIFSHWRIGAVFGSLSSCLPHLETLKLYIAEPYPKEKDFALPMLPNLKHLVLAIEDNNDALMHMVAIFLKASPMLQRLLIDLYYPVWPVSSNKSLKNKKGPICSHHHLKNLELKGYDGKVHDNELVEYLTRTVFSLQQIVIDPRRRWDREVSYEVKRQKQARERFQQLRAELPSAIKVVCL